jgi:replicative DNA helicase
LSEPIFESVGHGLKDLYANIDRRSLDADGNFGVMQPSGLPTGFTDLDALTAGLQPGELVGLASYPGVGKSALAMQIAFHVAVELKRRVLYVSLDESRVTLTERGLVQLAGVPIHRLRKGHLSGADMERLIECGTRMGAAPLLIDDSFGETLAWHIERARQLSPQYAPQLVVVDHVVLFQPDQPERPRQEQLAATTRDLKKWARSLNAPVLALAQLQRDPTGRMERRPRLEDLQDARTLAEDADTVLLLHRPELYEPGHHEVIVAKQRNGPEGDLTLTFRKDCLRFEDWDVTPPTVLPAGERGDL